MNRKCRSIHRSVSPRGTAQSIERMIQTIKEENDALVQEAAEAEETYSLKSSSRAASPKKPFGSKKGLSRRRSYSFFCRGSSSKNLNIKFNDSNNANNACGGGLMNIESADNFLEQSQSTLERAGRDTTGRSLNLKPERSSIFSGGSAMMGQIREETEFTRNNSLVKPNATFSPNNYQRKQRMIFSGGLRRCTSPISPEMVAQKKRSNA